MQSSLIARWALGVEYRRMVRFEAILSRFQRVLVCSETDRRALAVNVPNAPLDILPNGVDREAFSPNGSVEPDANRIIFTGNMSYYPNADAAKYFVRKIFPLVQRALPNARFSIVGQNPPAGVRRLAGVNVDVMGFVQDLRAEYMKSSVAVSPVRFGAGTLNKILEPLALGIPVVATPVSVQGMDPSQKGIVVGGTEEEFANAVVRVLRDPTYRKEALKASEELRDRYGWDRIAKTLEGIYKDVVEQSGRSADA
jgi:glycosyltransferase involved in cell wall biosynthesis